VAKEVHHTWGTLSLDIRTVNHRFLDIHCRLPDELKSAEMMIRKYISKYLSRGKVDITLRFEKYTKNEENLLFDVEYTKQLAKTLHEIDKILYNAAPINAMDILQWSGILTTKVIDKEVLLQAIENLLEVAVDELILVRQREGDALQKIILTGCHQLIDEVEKITDKIPEILQQQKSSLVNRFNELKLAVDMERLEQEMLFLMQKADVKEELDRLKIHITELQTLLQKNIPIGRKCDFILQEMNREANTLGSKSMHKLMTQCGIEMKVFIEQMREQVQNIE
jgi:uncharacterized protein (TIGR00255 family)